MARTPAAPSPLPTLQQCARAALQELHCARAYYNQVTHPELIQSALHRIDAAQHRYAYFMQALKALDGQPGPAAQDAPAPVQDAYVPPADAPAPASPPPAMAYGNAPAPAYRRAFPPPAVPGSAPQPLGRRSRRHGAKAEKTR